MDRIAGHIELARMFGGKSNFRMDKLAGRRKPLNLAPFILWNPADKFQVTLAKNHMERKEPVNSLALILYLFKFFQKIHHNPIEVLRVRLMRDVSRV